MALLSSTELRSLNGQGGDFGQDLGLNGRRKRSIVERRGIFLAVGDCPAEKVDDRRALLLVGLVLVDEQIGEAGNGVGVLARGVGDGDTEVVRHGDASRGSGSGLDAGL